MFEHHAISLFVNVVDELGRAVTARAGNPAHVREGNRQNIFDRGMLQHCLPALAAFDPERLEQTLRLSLCLAVTHLRRKLV